MNKLFESLNGFYDKLQDDLSRAYFDMHFEYFIDRNVDSLEEKLINVAPKNVSFGCGFLDRYFLRHPENKGKPFVIFGSGNAGKTTIRTLKYMWQLRTCCSK